MSKNPISTLLDYEHTSDSQVLLNSALCIITVGDLRAMRDERERLRIALVDAVHRLHSAPQHQLCEGIGMSEGGLGFGVHYRAADGLKHDVYASREEMDAIDAALKAERERVEEVLKRADAAQKDWKNSHP